MSELKQQARITKRHFIVLTTSAFASSALCFGLEPSKAGSPDTNSSVKHRSPEEWMAGWMNPSDRGGEKPLYLGRFKDPIYFITQPVSWTPNPGQTGYEPVTVPVGFVTDLASIPQLFWDALRPDGDYSYAAILHDYLYWTQQRTRQISDMIFKLVMQDFAIDPAKIEIIYSAVRLGGQSAWNNNRSLREAGEKRVLKNFPNDPRKTWAEWKKEKNVFVEHDGL